MARGPKRAWRRRSMLWLAVLVAGGLVASVIGAASAVGSSPAPAYDLQGGWINDSSSETYAIGPVDMSSGMFTGTGMGGSFSGSWPVGGTESGCQGQLYENYPDGSRLNANVTFSVAANGDLQAIGTYSVTDGGGTGPTRATTIEQTTPAAGAPQPSSACASAAGGTSPSGIQVICNDLHPGQAGDVDQCTAQVGGTSSANPSAIPTGTVEFRVNSGGSGGFPNGSTCTLAPSQGGGNTAFCAVNYSPPAAPETQPPITASYLGDQNFAPNSASPQSLGSGVTDTTTTGSTDTTTGTGTVETPVGCDAAQRLSARVADSPGNPSPCPIGTKVATVSEIKSLDGGQASAQVRHADGSVETIAVGTQIAVGDTIITQSGSVAAISFALGGRVGVNSGGSIYVANERSATDTTSTWTWLSNTGLSGIWNHLSQQSQPVLIQTNGGVMGTKG